MAKKKEEAPAEPKVSQLPLPATDTPVVIDLPDGQKLVIGQLASGSVIEVATWRGTGRPDSRTSRLMLGMSGGTVNPTTQQANIVEEVKPPAEGFAKVLAVLQTSIKVVAKQFEKLIQVIRGFSWQRINPVSAIEVVKERAKSSVSFVSKSEKSEDVSISVVRSSKIGSLDKINSSDDIEAWLDSVMAKAKKTRKKAAPQKKAVPKPKSSTKPRPKSTKSKKR